MMKGKGMDEDCHVLACNLFPAYLKVFQRNRECSARNVLASSVCS